MRRSRRGSICRCSTPSCPSRGLGRGPSAGLHLKDVRGNSTRKGLASGRLNSIIVSTRPYQTVRRASAGSVRKRSSRPGTTTARPAATRAHSCRSVVKPAVEASSSPAVLRRAVGLGFHGRGATERNAEKYEQAHEAPTTPSAPSAVLVVDHLDLRGLGSPVALAEAARSALLIRPFRQHRTTHRDATPQPVRNRCIPALPCARW
jgi:hypothetical protein